MRPDRTSAAATAIVSAVVLSVASATAHAAAVDDDIALMPEAHTRWIARDIELDGVAASLRAVHHRQPIERVIEYYRQAWTRYGEVRVSAPGQRRVVAVRAHARFVTLQLVPDAGSTAGVLTVSALPETAADTRPDLALPGSVRLLSRQVHRDGGAETETLTLSSPDGVASSVADLSSGWLAEGWQLRLDEPARRVEEGRRLLFGRGDERLSVYVARDRRWQDVTLIYLVRQPGTL